MLSVQLSMHAKELYGNKIRAVDGDAGKVHDLYFDDRQWKVRYIVVDTGAWLTGRRVLLSPQCALFVDGDGTIGVKLTKEQIEHAPSYETDKPVSRQYEEQLHRHYAWAPYWSPFWGVTSIGAAVPSYLDPNVGSQGPPEGDPHLRSARHVTGYHVEAADGQIGHVEDIILTGDEWQVRYLVVDTKNWWPGKSVLVSPAWVREIRWSESKVFFNVSKQTVRNSPEYDRSKPFSYSYDEELRKYYATNAAAA